MACCSAFKHKHRDTLRKHVLHVNIERKWKDIYLQSLTFQQFIANMFESVNCDFFFPFPLSMDLDDVPYIYSTYVFFLFCVLFEFTS